MLLLLSLLPSATNQQSIHSPLGHSILLYDPVHCTSVPIASRRTGGTALNWIIFIEPYQAVSVVCRNRSIRLDGFGLASHMDRDRQWQSLVPPPHPHSQLRLDTTVDTTISPAVEATVDRSGSNYTFAQYNSKRTKQTRTTINSFTVPPFHVNSRRMVN